MQPNQQFDPANLNFNFKEATVSSDGHVTMLNNAIDGMATINFIQLRPPEDGKPQADVVASVSFPNMVAFKNFVTNLQSSLKQQEQRKR